MKRIYIIIGLIVCLLLICNSCSNSSAQNKAEYIEKLLGSTDWEYTTSSDEPLDNYVSVRKPFQYYEGSIYFFNGNSSVFLNENADETVTLKRLNVETGNITNVCPDPLCTHTTSSCPFSGSIDSFYIDDSNIVYIRSYVQQMQNKKVGVRQFCSYDLKDMKFTAHKTEKLTSGITYAQYSKMLYHSGNCYYYDYIFEETTQKYRWVFNRLNLKTNQISMIGDEEFYDTGEGNPFVEEFLFIINDRIYFKSVNTIFSTSTDLTDKQIHAEGTFMSNNIYTNGKYIYYGIPDGNDIIEKIYRLDLDGKNNTDLGIQTTKDWFITSQYIYYYRPNYFEMPTTTQSGSVIFFNDAMCRCGHDGKNNEIVFYADHAKENETNKYFQLSSNIVVGNYIYSMYYFVEDSNKNNLVDDGEFYQSTNGYYDFNIIRINTKTSNVEYLYINQ